MQHYFETLAKGYEGAAFGDTHAVEINPDLIDLRRLCHFYRQSATANISPCFTG